MIQVRDFTLQKYEELCRGVLESGYIPMTIFSYLSERPSGQRVCILRHDVDRKPVNALRMAELESRIGIRSTYYFRYPYTFNPDIIRKIASLGHEIGYHYETLAKAGGDHQKAIQLFERELTEFRKIANVRTICMHGSPLSKYDNRELWKHEDFKRFGIIGEAYLSIKDVVYLTDTGRSWNSMNNIRDNIDGQIPNLPIDNTNEMLEFIIKNINNIYITTHPERWAYSGSDWVLQYAKDIIFNIGKIILLLRRRYAQGR